MCPMDEDVIDTAVERLRENGCRVTLIKGQPAPQSLAKCLEDLLKEKPQKDGHKPRLAVSERVLQDWDISSLLQNISSQLCIYGGDEDDRDTLDAIARADVAISGADVLVADTGTIVLAGDEAMSRIACILPPVQAVIMRSNRVVAHLDESVSEICAGEMPTYATYIGGPSKTADIELELVEGMHGPKEVHVFLLDGTSSREV